MKISVSILLIASTGAFQAPRRAALRSNKQLSAAAASPEEELTDSLQGGKLKQAIRVLEQNPSLNLSKETFGKVFDCIELTTEMAEENSSNARLLEEQQLSRYPPKSPARMDMTNMYNALRTTGKLKLFGACEEQPLASGSKTVTPLLLEEITNLSMTALTPKPTNTLLFAGVALAGLEVIAAVAFGWNVNLLVFLTLTAGLMDRLFINGVLFESAVRIIQPQLQSKILKHEAGHFLCAYLLGCPVEGCVLSGWAALQDARFDKRQVTAGTSFFDPILSEEMNTGTVTRGSVDRYSVIVMGGIAAEAMNFGGADGGAGDEMALVSFLSQLNIASKGQAWNNNSIRNQARWGALQAVLLLREYRACYDGLVDALERGGNLGDCIYAIEKAGRDAGLGPVKRPIGWISDQGDYGTWSTHPPEESATKIPAAQLRLSEEDSLQALQNARQVMEDRLQAINEQLKGLNE